MCNIKKLIFLFTFTTFFFLLSEETVAAINATVYPGGSWSPYLTGSLIGLLVCATLYFSQEPVGASSAYATLAGIIGKKLAPEHTCKLEYYQKNPPVINWEFTFFLSIVLGSFLAAASGNELLVEWIPQFWKDTHRETSDFSYGVIAFIGGVLMAFGARLAGGCTSGHGISGTIQLSLASWISLVCFFIGGVFAVRLLF